MDKYYFIMLSPCVEFHEFSNYLGLIDYLNRIKEELKIEDSIFKIIVGGEWKIEEELEWQ